MYLYGYVRVMVSKNEKEMKPWLVWSGLVWPRSRMVEAEERGRKKAKLGLSMESMEMSDGAPKNPLDSGERGTLVVSGQLLAVEALSICVGYLISAPSRVLLADVSPH